MITSTIKIDDEKGHLPKVFAPEQQRLINDRAEYEVNRRNGVTTIKITAKDATALRAVLNSVCKILIVYEKAQKVVNNG